MTQGKIAIGGDLGIKVTRNRRDVGWGYKVRNAPNVLRGYVKHEIASLLGIGHFYSRLYAVVHHGDGRITDYGLISTRVVTTAGVNYLVDAFQGTVEPENLKFHGIGTGSTAEAVGDTGLVTELTTQYAGDTRTTGSTTEGASANIYRTVATITPDSGHPIVLREHGVFSAASAGTLWDRSVYAAITLESTSDSVTYTYDCTFSAGS
jgi:hypothetical protein